MRGRTQTGKCKEEQRLMKRQDCISYPESLKGFHVQLRNVEREPMGCRMELSQSCHKEDRCSIPTECGICTYTCAAEGQERGFAAGFFCFLLENTSHPFVLLQGRSFTHRDLFSSSLLNLLCIHSSSWKQSLSGQVTGLSTLQNPALKDMLCQVVQKHAPCCFTQDV